MHLSLAKFSRYKLRCILFEWHKATLTEEIRDIELVAAFQVKVKLSQALSQLKTLTWRRKLIEVKRRRLKILIWKWHQLAKDEESIPS
jgi:hypothetical protein